MGGTGSQYQIFIVPLFPLFWRLNTVPTVAFAKNQAATTDGGMGTVSALAHSPPSAERCVSDNMVHREEGHKSEAEARPP